MFVAIFTAITIGCLAGNTRESKSIDGADRLKSIEATGQWTINLIQSTKPSIKVEYPNAFSDKIIAEVRPDGTLYLGFKKNIVGTLYSLKKHNSRSNIPHVKPAILAIFSCFLCLGTPQR